MYTSFLNMIKEKRNYHIKMPNLEQCRERILSNDYRDFIINRLALEEFQEVITANTCRQEMEFIYDTAYIEKEVADPLSFGRYSYNAVPKCYTLLDMEAMAQAGILQVQNYPTLDLQGTGIMIGFIDTGIDYQNTIFRNLDGSTRVVGIWDQTIQEGSPPKGLFYGTEYRQEDINKALRSENPLQIVPSVDEQTHGTFLASITAGSANIENQFIGAAPDAAIAMVKLKPAKSYLKEFYKIYTDAPCYQETDIMLALKYLNELAEELQLPLVICIALGTNQGGHSATSPLSGLLEIYSNLENRAIVIAGGNEANQRHHYLGKAENVNDRKEVEIRVADGVDGFSMELWTENPNIFGVTVVSPSGGSTLRFPIRRNETQEYRFIFEGSKIYINYKLFLERSDSELIFLRLEKPTEGIWKVIVEPVQVAEGVFHMWLPMTEFLQNEVYFLESNPDYTITEPGSTITAMTVGFYDGRENGIAISSGRGYTRGGIVKPNFVAPGVNVTGATIRNQFVKRSGSSIAAGITAGASALMLEWVIYQLREGAADSIQIRNLLTLGTERRWNEAYPNRTWGYGRLNLYQTFDELRRL